MSVSLLCAGCSNEPESGLAGRADSVATVPGLPPSSGLTAEAPSTVSIADRAVLFVEASEAEIDAARQGVSEQDFAVIADDLMYYRSSAAEWLETWQIPFTRLTGRRALRFTVDAVPQRFAFEDITTLDFIVVYLPNEMPRTFAPNEVDAVRAYWQSGSAVSASTN
jgi:hypothetical protein